MSDAAAALPKLDNTFGAMYLGVIIAMALWGASTIQAYYYYDTYPKDAWQLKLLVAVVWALDSAHQALITASVYRYLITNFFNPAHLNAIEATLRHMVILNVVIIAVVQGFFLFRVWRLSQKNYVLVGILGILNGAQFVSIAVYYGKCYHMTSLAQLQTLLTLEKICNVFGAVSDISIAGTLVFLLRKSRTGFKRTETLVNRLVMFTINTGLITSMCAIMALVSVLAWPNTFLYIAFYLLISRLYTNSLLATLNARASLGRSSPGATTQDESQLNSFHLSRVKIGDTKNSTGHMGVKVDTETYVDSFKSAPSQNTMQYNFKPAQ
ncbi:hypothetical protein SCHPADRAFT_900136 [Schizopora paradoxa]|uniref:DUF6534 domain-containing protein n=1 Tax=Schizopora paradoxa TaxID=27342 RepID=A0A0H2SLK7_9AGAM|nr:hypothetical protein SCHPADRAFT_900136 [Schizopora paradoxa]